MLHLSHVASGNSIRASISQQFERGDSPLSTSASQCRKWHRYLVHYNAVKYVHNLHNIADLFGFLLVVECQIAILSSPRSCIQAFPNADRSWGLHISISIIAGPKSDSGNPNFFTLSKNFKKSLNSLYAFLESFPSRVLTAKQ
jgi:hypothetical protein